VKLSEKNKSKFKGIIVSIPLFVKMSISATTQFNPRVFVYHRFCSKPGTYAHRVSQEAFEFQVSQIAKYFKVMTLAEYLLLKHQKKDIPKNVAVLTIDDGYHDFYDFAYPVLKKYGIKATFFVTVNFINRTLWLWPDRIDYAIKNTIHAFCDFHFKDVHFEFELKNETLKFNCWRQLTNYGISLENNEKWKFIRYVEERLCVKLPDDMPDEYRPVTWDQLKEMSDNGIEIGSHTMNHPILSKIHGDELVFEIDESRKEIERRLGIEVLSFCYPNSAKKDINDDVLRQVELSGYRGAVFGGYPDCGDLYRVPRMGVTDDSVDFLWKLSGMEIINRLR
jgi:peptidoglycan/xylan/chitin deacetylase (PgdA/CDA1 family)